MIMDTCKSYEKKDLSHSYICRLFLEGALLFWILRTAALLIAAGWLCFCPESAIELTDTGEAYRFELFCGYVQYGKENLPVGIEIVNNKTFCIAFLVLSVLTKELPVLAALGYLRKILNVIRDSHSPFVGQTAEYVGKIGKLLILTGIFGKLVLQMGLGLLAFHAPNMVNPLEFSWIFAGIIVLLIGDILRWGCELQEFSDETL